MKTLTKRVMMYLLTFVMMFSFASIIPASAATTYTVTVSSAQKYSMAYSVLDLINKERTEAGLSKLTMDKELLEAAMQRAAEISVKFDHTRPNGESCSTAFDWDYAVGENIAYGQTSANAVYTAWYKSEGHHNNYMSSSYVSTGIGCAYINGTYYWVNVFDGGTPVSASKPSDNTKTRTIKISSDFYSTYCPSTKPTISSITTSNGKVTIKWSKISNASGYRVYRYNTSTSSYEKIATIKSKSTVTYTDSSATIGEKAKYVVKAYRKSNGYTGWSAKSAAKSITVKPATPKMTTASKTKTAVRINWKAVSCDGYRIYMYDSSTKKYKYIKTVSSSKTTYRISGLKSGTAYKFKVRAYVKNSSGTKVYSGYSSVKKATTKS